MAKAVLSSTKSRIRKKRRNAKKVRGLAPDPIFAAMAAHCAAFADFNVALDIPETPEHMAHRKREESRTCSILHRVEDRLSLTRPTTVMGAVAALAYFAIPNTSLSDFVDEPHTVFLRTMIGALVRLTGPAEVAAAVGGLAHGAR